MNRFDRRITGPGNIGLLATGSDRWVAGKIYTQNLARALRRLPIDERGEVVLMQGPRSRDAECSELLPDVDRFFRFDYRRSASWRNKALSLGYALPRFRRPVDLEKCCQAFGLRAVFPVLSDWCGTTETSSITWIPDFQHCHYPRLFPGKTIRSRQLSYQRRIDRGTVVVVSSEHARRDMVRFFRTDCANIAVLPFVSMASDEWYRVDPSLVASRYELPARFLICPSQFWQHKNHETLFKAISIARRRGLRDLFLVCTGQTQDWRRPDYFERLMNLLCRYRLTNEVRILGLLPRIDQIQLLRRAAAVIQPSLFEGWSAIVEDARTLGKRMLVSDISVHREQAPPRCDFFNPMDAEGLADQLVAVWPELSAGPEVDRETEAYRDHLARGNTFAQRFLQIVEQATSVQRSACRQPTTRTAMGVRRQKAS